MYCNQCGAENPNDSKFCKACGRPLAIGHGSEDGIKYDKPVLTFKPAFEPKLVCTSSIPIALPFSIFIGFLLGNLLKSIFNIQGSTIYWIIGFLCFIAIPLIQYFGFKKIYSLTEYRFFPDKLEYYEGFFTVEEKTIYYNKIVEANLSKGILQKQYGLGTIILSTAHGGTRGGIRIQDIKNPDETYKKIKELIDKIS